ncbi:hypothetical protein Bca52824_052384 [Brassica carinata]|uniref:CG-1 domain-containing protein n=1 Tax=Brassica carinata TaxID=52824 RepID=A0A8X7R294_BRACI|nr:hypothetical protein Bca52824_052384 [Brassica carinata]
MLNGVSPRDIKSLRQGSQLLAAAIWVELMLLRRAQPKVLRYFRKDGHNWRNKKDGKTVKEAHEKLKVGSIDVLHCYYAHEEDNENFQRRCYWMLEQSFSGLVRAIIHLKDIDRDIRKALV